MTLSSAPQVLLVEDEALLRELVVEALQEARFKVIEAPDGATALQVLASGQPLDALVSDIKLPDIDGYKVAEAGQASRPGLKIILMTGYAPAPLPAALETAVHRVLQKPFALDALLGALEGALCK